MENINPGFFFGWTLNGKNEAMLKRLNSIALMSFQKTSPQIQEMLTQGGYIWYNIFYPNIEPVLVKPNQFQAYYQLSDHLLKLIPKKDRFFLWEHLKDKQGSTRIEAFVTAFQKRNDWSNWRRLKSCYGWKVVKAEHFQELKVAIKEWNEPQTRIDSVLKSGDITFIHKNPKIPALYVPPNYVCVKIKI